MTTMAYQRATARENKIWSPFTYSYPLDAGQVQERAVIFGLYSSSHLNRHDYLEDVEATDLANILNDYNAKMADLTAQEAIVVQDISARRYVAGIDKLIHDEKMITARQGIDAENAEWDAKIAAIEVDRVALATLAAKVESETKKIEARIAELQAYIQIEGINLSMVDIEIAEKELESARKDVEILNAANEILKIQLAIVNAGLELVDIDLQMARTKLDIQNLLRQIALAEGTADKLEMEQNQTAVSEIETDILSQRLTAAERKYTEMVREYSRCYALITTEGRMKTQREAEMDSERTRQEGAIADRYNAAAYSDQAKADNAKFDKQTATDAQKTTEKVTAYDVEVIQERITAAEVKYKAEVAAEKTLATANITTILSHSIGGS